MDFLPDPPLHIPLAGIFTLYLKDLLFSRAGITASET